MITYQVFFSPSNGTQPASITAAAAITAQMQKGTSAHQPPATAYHSPM